MMRLGFSLIVVAHGESLGDRVVASFTMQQQMPLRKEDVQDSANFHLVGPNQCDPQFGYRYQWEGARVPILMFDNQDDIAGIQIVINSQEFPLYPGSNMKANQFVPQTGLSKDEGDWGVTAYFKDPAQICSSGTRAQDGSIGDRLWIANAEEPSGFLEVPLRHSENEMFNGRWKSSGCAPTGFLFPGSAGMGLHYWSMQDRQGNTPCIESDPVFFLYDHGRLNGFGFQISGFDYRVPTVGNVRPTGWEDPQAFLRPPGREMVEFARHPMEPYVFAVGESPKCSENINMFDTSNHGDVTGGTLHVLFRDPFNISCASSPDFSSVDSGYISGAVHTGYHLWLVILVARTVLV